MPVRYPTETIGTSTISARFMHAGLILEPGLADERIVAVGLLTQRDLDVLGKSFTRVWPVDETPCFSELLQAIDEADRELRRAREAERATPE